MFRNIFTLIVVLIGVAMISAICDLFAGFWNATVVGHYEIGYSHTRGMGLRGLRIRYVRRFR
jgi:hypothetical protein